MKKKLLIGLALVVGIMFSGCSLATKAVGINEKINLQGVESLSNLGAGYQPTITYIGEVDFNKDNVQKINKSISDLYNVMKNINTYSSQNYEMLVDKCKSRVKATNVGALRTQNIIESQCRKILQNDGMQKVNKIENHGFKISLIGYPNRYARKIKSLDTGRFYHEIEPLKTGIKNTIFMVDYDVGFQVRGKVRNLKAHISFVPLGDKINIVFNYTPLNDSKYPLNIQGDYTKKYFSNFLAVKNEFYDILNKNGIVIDYNKEVSLSEYDFAQIAYGVQKVLNDNGTIKQ